MAVIMQWSQSSTVEEAWIIIEKFNKFKAEKLWNQLAKTVEEKSFAYVNRYIDSDMKICAVIFDRQRKVRWQEELKNICLILNMINFYSVCFCK